MGSLALAFFPAVPVPIRCEFRHLFLPDDQSSSPSLRGLPLDAGMDADGISLQLTTRTLGNPSQFGLSESEAIAGDEPIAPPIYRYGDKQLDAA
jgi:hypothetical protein